jgi:hypothetical protein
LRYGQLLLVLLWLLQVPHAQARQLVLRLQQLLLLLLLPRGLLLP